MKMAKLIFRIFLLPLFMCLAFTVEAHAQKSVPIEKGSWSGVHQCFNGQMPVNFYVHGTSSGSRVDVSYSHMKYTYSSAKDRKFTAKLKKTKDRRYDPLYKVKYDTVVVFQGLTRKYLWEPTGISGSTKCHGAVLVQDRPGLFLDYKTNNELCYGVRNWLGDPKRVRSIISNAVSRSQLSGFDIDLAVWGHYFSDRHFNKHFGRNFSGLDADELLEVIAMMHDCARYSTSNRHIIGKVSWFFDPQTVGRWASLFPFGGLYGMSWDPSNNSVWVAQERFALIQQAAKTRETIDQSITELFLEPESPELKGKIDRLRTTVVKDLVFQEVSFIQEVLNLLSARDEMLRASEALAVQFRLSEYPKLPPPHNQADARLVDDALLKPLTDQEILLLEQSVEQDF